MLSAAITAMPDHPKDLKSLLDAFRDGTVSEEAVLEQIGGGRIEAAGGTDSRDEAARRRTSGSGVEEAALLAQLDACRAAEASGSTTMESWADLSSDPVLAGGLRTAAAREATHALLLERRIRELDGQLEAELPDWLARFNAAILDPKARDVDRLGAIVAEFPDPEKALEPLNALIEAASGDPLTHELLSTIRDDERVTLRWMHASYKRVRQATLDDTTR